MTTRVEERDQGPRGDPADGPGSTPEASFRRRDDRIHHDASLGAQCRPQLGCQGPDRSRSYGGSA